VTVETADKKNAEILVSLDGKTETHEERLLNRRSPRRTRTLNERAPERRDQRLKAKFPKSEIKSAEKAKRRQAHLRSDHQEHKHDIDVTLSTRVKS